MTVPPRAPLSPRPLSLPDAYGALGELVHDVGPITITTSRGPVVCMDEQTYASLLHAHTASSSGPLGMDCQPEIDRDEPPRGDPDDAVKLTARERELLGAVAAGHSVPIVAYQRGLAINTVSQHLASIRRKYRVRTTANAITLARSAGQL